MLFLDLPWVHPVHTLAFSPDGQTLASVCGKACEVQLWDLTTRQVACTLQGHAKRVVAAAFAPSGELFASATFAGSVWVWSRRPSQAWHVTRAHQWEREPHRNAPGRLAFSPDSKLLATSEREEPQGGVRHRYWTDHQSRVSLLQMGRDRVLSVTTKHTDEVSCLAFSPDGQTLATGSFDRAVRLHPLPKGTPRVLDQAQKVHYLAFSPDGATLASGSPGGMVRLWDGASGDRRATFHHAPGPLHALCYSPDGRTVATAGGKEQGTVRFWDVATASCLSALDWEIGELHAVAFAPDGMRAAAGGVGKIVVWDIDTWGR
jgi:WD40 repeat protein